MPLNRRELLGLFRDPSVLARQRQQDRPDQQDSSSAKLSGINIDSSRCLAWQETLCLICLEACPEGAIRFEGLRNPQVVKDVCTLCGDCIPVCPGTAFAVSRDSEPSAAREEEGMA